ncbi:HSD17B2 [Bugula neritina]|uniref:11-beta-hydroxysteroid dehydrogenase type 2 n=1 Tax=Bugula neritina TaxID=10212 RepID=A0A7J7KK81_BUGNE|nr:HSD17B2 [Bugula neritina]KAF6038667.1 HSD17B2 [Bugula neritina]
MFGGIEMDSVNQEAIFQSAASMQDDINHERLPIVHLWLAATAAAMLLAAFNIIGGSDRKSLWSWSKSVKKETASPLNLAKKYVLVTGCDKGLGYATAKSLDKHGYSVIAGCYNVKGENVQRLQKETSSKLQAVQLDVTKTEDLESVRQWMNSNLDGELWGIVNNAGVCFVGTPEIMAQKDIDNVLAVNLMGVINVTNKFLPLVRQSKGRIVNIGSISGEVPMPFFAIYNASKAAVKMLTETWSYELLPWGVKVSLITPSAFQTDIIQYDRGEIATRWWKEADEEVQRDFGQDFFRMNMRPSGRFRVCKDLSPVANSIIHALSAEKPRPLYRVGQWSTLLPNLFKFSPQPLRYVLGSSVFNFITDQPLGVQTKSK